MRFLVAVIFAAGLLTPGCPRSDSTETPTPVAVNCAPNPSPSTAARAPFTLDTPGFGAQSMSPLHLTGESSLNESLFRARLTGVDGTLLAQVPLWIVSTGERYLDYEIVVGFDVAATTPACLEVYLETSRDDPTPRDIVRRDVVLLPGAETAGGVCPLNEVPPRDFYDPDMVVESPVDLERGKWDELTRSQSPLSVWGKARVFEGTVSVRLLAPAAREMAAVTTQADAGAPELADFAVQVPFDVTRLTAACVQVFSLSPKDGSVENLVQREVLLEP